MALIKLIIYDLKCNLYVMEKFCDFLKDLLTYVQP